MRGQLPPREMRELNVLGGSKAKGDFSRVEWEEKGVVRMLRRRSLRGFWKIGDVGKRKGFFLGKS